MVARDPRPDLYRGVGDASQILVISKMTSTGRGLNTKTKQTIRFVNKTKQTLTVVNKH